MTDVLTEWEYWQLHGEHEPVSLPSPAGGQGALHVVPGTVEEELLSVSFMLTCSADVNNRLPWIAFFDWAQVPFAVVGAPFTFVANDTTQVTFGVGLNQFGANSAVRVGAPIPALRLGDGLSWQVWADGMTSNDRIYNVRAFVRQWRVRE